jgi:hypothetical protein
MVGSLVMVRLFYNLSLFTVLISILLWLPVETACKIPHVHKIFFFQRQVEQFADSML